ncbi:hypothetical protein BDR04DRAFT_1116558 [Suillus decipiens]|nr:hypothetical protein BDR04DRAFT_1116558 [Suillus decipiens]
MAIIGIWYFFYKHKPGYTWQLQTFVLYFWDVCFFIGTGTIGDGYCALQGDKCFTIRIMCSIYGLNISSVFMMSVGVICSLVSIIGVTMESTSRVAAGQVTFGFIRGIQYGLISICQSEICVLKACLAATLVGQECSTQEVADNAKGSGSIAANSAMKAAVADANAC